MSNAKPIANRIEPLPDGPVKITGNIELMDDDGQVIGNESEVYICRCGKSENRPFCDGSHGSCNFRATGDVGEARSREPEDPEGALQMRLLANGPVMLNGPLEIVDGDGASQVRSIKAALCRCGGSKNRPFCDGEHKELGFEADTCYAE